MFNQCYSLKEIVGINKFILSNVAKKKEMFSNCKNLKGLSLSNLNIQTKKDTSCQKGNQIELNFYSIDQNISYKTTCYDSDNFEKIEKELLEKKPELQSKKTLTFLGNGTVLDRRETLNNNGIKSDATILIDFDD